MAMAAAALLFCSCGKEEEAGPSKVFKSQTEISLMKDDNLILSYDEDTWQLSSSMDQGTFVAGKDDMSEYFEVKADASQDLSDLSQGDSFRGDLSYKKDLVSVSMAGQKWKVTSMVDDSYGTKIWLWCAKEHIGVVVYKIK